MSKIISVLFLFIGLFIVIECVTLNMSGKYSVGCKKLSDAVSASKSSKSGNSEDSREDGAIVGEKDKNRKRKKSKRVC